MNTLRLLLYIIILIVSVINLISYYSKKRKQKALSGEIAESLTSERTLTSREAVALSRLNDREIAPGTAVSRIEGAYESNTLTIKGSTSEKVVTIGGIVVNFYDQLETHLQDWNSLEIVDAGHKKGAAVLSLNGSFSAVEESEIRAALSEGRVYQKREKESDDNNDSEKSFEFNSGRGMRNEERAYLMPDYRVWPSMLCALFSFAAVSFSLLPLKVVSAVLAILLFTIYIIPVHSRVKDKKYQKKIINLSGTLEKVSDSYKVGRFTLEFPKGWESKVLPGQKIKVEAYPMNDLGVNLKVLSLNNIYSIYKEQVKSPSVKNDRFLSLAVCLGAAMVLLLLPLGKIPYKIGQTINYYSARGLQENFNSFEELRDYPLKKGQILNLHNMAYMPNYDHDRYGVFIVKNGPYRGPDLSKVKKKLDVLDKMQMSEEMFFMTAISMKSRIDIYSFYNEFYPLSLDEELPSMMMYNKFFSDAKYYPMLTEIIEAIDALPENFKDDDPIVFPKGGHLKAHFEKWISGEYWTNETLLSEVNTILNQFNWEQYELTRDAVENEYIKFLESEDALFINSFENSLSYNYDGYFSLNDRDVEKFHTSIYHMSTGKYELEIAEPIQAIVKLKNYESQLKDSYGRTDFQGVITEMEWEGDRISVLTMKDISYDKRYFYMADIGYFTLILLIAFYAGVLWFKMRVSNKR